MLSLQCTSKVALALLGTVALCLPADIRGEVVASDLLRAAKRIPSERYRGLDFEDMNVKLNGHLAQMRGVSTKSCSSFSAQQLQDEVLRPVFHLASQELLSIYALHGDRRHRVPRSLKELQQTWSRMNAIIVEHPELHDVQRDGLCHEAVMWFVHHLSEETRRTVAGNLSIPMLPLRRHSSDSNRALRQTDSSKQTSAHREVYAEYESKVSCQQCHSGPVAGFTSNATLPPPLPVDTKHPGRERLRQCTYQNDPPCGPCDGLGGARWSDEVDAFAPMNCTVFAKPEDVAASDRPKPTYPAMGKASMDGETRSPLEVWPRAKGTYPSVEGTIYLAWDNTMSRHRYDFGEDGSQIYLQSAAQLASGNSSGVMVTITSGKSAENATPKCMCMDAIAGIMHIDSFVPHEPHDRVDLPPEEGGLNYLGRVMLSPLDGGIKQPMLADHYMKWAFHFLVDANKSSASYGLPLRLYGAQGVRMVYSKWSLADPRISQPDLFEIPKNCTTQSQLCKQMMATTSQSGQQTDAREVFV